MTTLSASPHTLQRSLIDALAAGDPERALEQAFHQLARGGSLALVLAMVKTLVRCGLAGIAAKLLHSFSGLLTAEPQLASLANQLDRLPSGEVPESDLRHRRQSNTEALLRFQPHLEACVLEEPGPAHRVYRSVKGNYYVLRDHAGGQLDFVFPFVDQAAQAESLKMPAIVVSSAFLMIGVPNPALWRRILGIRLPCGYAPPIDIIETDARVLTLWLSLIDHCDSAWDGRVSLFLGPEAIQEYKLFLINHPTRHPATDCLTNVRPGWQPPVLDKEFNERVVEAAARGKRAKKAGLDAVYAGKDTAYWRARFRTASPGTPPLRLVGFTSRFSTVIQHSMRDLASAFARLGCDFHVVKQCDDSTAAVDEIGTLSRLQPDVVVVINHIRDELINSIPLNLPYVCWIQDYMPQLCDRRAGQSIGDFDLVLGHSPDTMATHYDYPPDRFLATNNLTSPDVFSHEPVASSELDAFRCDMSYAGHGWETPDALIVEMSGDNAALAAYLQSLLHTARRRLAANGFFTTQDLVELVLDAEKASAHRPLSPQVRRKVIIPAAQRLLDRLLRHETLEWAARWAQRNNRTFRIHGRGWDRHPTFARYARGELAHGHQLRCLYQASSINLQVNAYGSMHQRLLDGVAAGGFVLSRYVPADFVAAPFRTIQKIILQIGLATLADLHNHRKVCPELDGAIRRVEVLTGTRLSPMSDPIRAAQGHSHIQCASLDANDFTDEGLFNLLRTAKAVPHRVAGDIDGFEATTFRTEADFHAMLDCYVDESPRRAAVTAPMRAAVLAHDTYDQLAQRILEAFHTRWG